MTLKACVKDYPKPGVNFLESGAEIVSFTGEVFILVGTLDAKTLILRKSGQTVFHEKSVTDFPRMSIVEVEEMNGITSAVIGIIEYLLDSVCTPGHERRLNNLRREALGLKKIEDGGSD